MKFSNRLGRDMMETSIKRKSDQHMSERSEKKKMREKFRREESNTKLQELLSAVDYIGQNILDPNENLQVQRETASAKTDLICRTILVLNALVKQNKALQEQNELLSMQYNRGEKNILKHVSVKSSVIESSMLHSGSVLRTQPNTNAINTTTDATVSISDTTVRTGLVPIYIPETVLSAILANNNGQVSSAGKFGAVTAVRTHPTRDISTSLSPSSLSWHHSMYTANASNNNTPTYPRSPSHASTFYDSSSSCSSLSLSSIIDTTSLSYEPNATRRAVSEAIDFTAVDNNEPMFANSGEDKDSIIVMATESFTDVCDLKCCDDMDFFMFDVDDAPFSPYRSLEDCDMDCNIPAPTHAECA